MLSRPIRLRLLLTKVGGPHKRVDMPEKGSVFTSVRRGAVCSAITLLSFACWRWATFRIQRLKVHSKVLSVVLRILLQSAVPSMGRMLWVQVAGSRGPG